MAEDKKGPVPQTPVVPPKEAGTAIVNWEEELNKLTIATAEAEKPSGNWFSFRAGVLQLGGNPIKGNKAPLVVIHSIFENQLYANIKPDGSLYEQRFDSDNPTTPICFAFAETDDELAPHEDSLKPQAETCAECRWNAWGSDLGGGKGKGCKNVRRLAMISANDLKTAETVKKAEVAMAKLPVTSVKNWSTYANQIANILKIPPLAVITEMELVPDPKTQFQVEFRLVDKITDRDILQALLSKRKDTTPLIFAPYDKPTILDQNAAVAVQAPKKY